MSNKVSTLVYSRKVGSAHRKAVLAYMADKASDDGSGIFCSKGTIADEAEIARSTVFKIVKDLVDEGILVVTGSRACRNGETVVYRMDLAKVEALEPTVSGSQKRRDQSASRTSPQRDQSAQRTPLVRQPDPYQSASRTLTILGTTLEQDGGGSAGARSEILLDEPTPRERLLTAMGLTSGITATGRMLGNPGDMAEAKRWAEMGLTLDQQRDVIRELMAKKRDGPPSSFRYFTEAMRRRAGELTAPPLQPIHSEHRKATQNERHAFDHAIHETAKRLSDGSVALETASRDPFAVRRG